MKKITVDLKSRSYPIYIEPGLVKKIPSYLSEYNKGQKWVIISQQNIMEIIGYDIEKYLIEKGFDCIHFTLPIGEAAKSMNEYNRAISQMIENECDRKTFIVSLGGGAVGDVAGFIASTYMRGIAYIQIPTTLLSMVDSSIGGKTGVNTSEGKNLIGSIYQPRAVFIDQEILKTLPRQEIISGLGEIIKYGAIANQNFFDKVSEWLDDIQNFPYNQAIEICCKIKADIVSKDEHDFGVRKILNFGHTIGHALESLYGFKNIRHGEAVALGMICSGYISNKLNKLDKNQYFRLRDTINKLPLPVLKKFNESQIFDYIKKDKKYENGKLKFIILNQIGNAEITNQVDEKLLLKSLSEL